MKRLLKVTGAITFALVAFTQNAAAIPSTAAISSSELRENLRTGVTPVHYGHKNRCQRGYVPRWGVKARHRHVGRDNKRPKACGKRYRGKGKPYRYRNRGCFKAGPIWYCP